MIQLLILATSLFIGISGGLLGGFLISGEFFKHPPIYFSDDQYWETSPDFGERAPLLPSREVELNKSHDKSRDQGKYHQ